MTPLSSPTPPLDPTRILFCADQISQRVNELAKTIAHDYGQDEFLAISIMKGSFIFTADLMRSLANHNIHPILDFMTLSSYGSGTSSHGTISIQSDIDVPVTGLRVLLIDDILDTGLTLQTATRLLTERGAREVRTCVLLDKPARRSVSVQATYCGFQIEDVFIVGYGLDLDHRYRQLPYLTTLSPDTSP
jgi:hypoxanthine phosphoribosyltransferase